jgi:hypothetical protein
MKYMLLIYAAEGAWGAATPEEQEAELAKWFGYTADLEKAGVLIAGDALHPTSSATTLRVRDGKRMTTDGPFAETKEALGGYYLLDVESLDDALAWAEKCPGAFYGSIEVRPLMVFDMPEGSA